MWEEVPSSAMAEQGSIATFYWSEVPQVAVVHDS